VLHPHPLLAVHSAPPQIVDVRNRDLREPFVGWLAEHFVLAVQNPAQRRAAQILVRGIGGGQQMNVFLAIAADKVRSAWRLAPDGSMLHPLRDQPRHLRPADGCHLRQKLSHHAALALAQFAVAPLSQNGAYEVVLCFRVFACPCDLSASGQQILHLAQGELVQVLHADLHSSAASLFQAHPALESLCPFGLAPHWNHFARSGSPRIGITLPVRARPALESHRPFRLIPRWTILLLSIGRF
jgi:hypothetical protein